MTARNRWRSAIGLVLGGGLLASVWFLSHRPPPSAPAEARVSIRPFAWSDVMPATEPATAVPEASVASAALPESEQELCGGARVRVGSDGAAGRLDIEKATGAQQLRERVIAALRAEDTPRSSAAAVMIRASHGYWARVRDAADRCTDVGCAQGIGRQGDLAASEELARMAALGSDPQVYAWALQACAASGQDAGVCSQLSNAQWTRLDPDNATPWLAMLAEATQRHDDVGASEALHRIATARRDDTGWGRLGASVLAHAGSSEQELPATLLLSGDALDTQSAFPQSGYQALLKACDGSRLRDANRRQECAAAAEVLTERADSLFGRSTGGVLGSRVGWSDDRLDVLRGGYRAYIDSFRTAPGSDPLDGIPVSCAGIRAQLERLRLVAKVGEAGAMREWIVHSGRTPEDLMREERARRAAAASDRAAASASAPAR